MCSCKCRHSITRNTERGTVCVCVCVSGCVSVYLCVCVMPSRRCLMLSQRGLIQIIRSIKSLSLPQLGLAFHLLHTHARTHTHLQLYGIPVLDYPLGGAVYPDRQPCPVGEFLEQTVASRMQFTLLSKDLRSAALSLTYLNIFTTLLLPHLTFL